MTERTGELVADERLLFLIELSIEPMRQHEGGAGKLADFRADLPGREPWEYCGTSRSAGGAWENRVTRLSIRELLSIDLAMTTVP